MAPLNKFQVLLAHHEHPEWTNPEIAKHLGCEPEYVRRHLATAGKKAPPGKRSGRPKSRPTQEQHA